MGREQLASRLLASEALVEGTKLRSGDLTEAEWARLIEAGDILRRADLYFDDSPGLTVLEMKDDWAADAYFMHRNAMKIYIDGSRIQIRTQTTAKAITEQGVLCAGPDGEVLVEADTILLAAGMKPDRAAVDAFYNTAPRVFQVGDCIQTGRVVDAVGMGYSIALDI